MKRSRATLIACIFVLTALACGQTSQPPTDILGVHNLGAGSSPVRGSSSSACTYCHAPHNALSTVPLWNQTLSTRQYMLYPGAVPDATKAVSVSKSSMLCLSCHDGSVAVGQSVSSGQLKMTGALATNLGTTLEGSHPFSIQPEIRDAPSLVATLVSSHATKDPAVSLINSNVECSTCHDVHNQFKDKRALDFLVRDNTSSALCFACHDTGARNVNGRDNSLTGWAKSVHATSTATVAPKANLGGYTTISEFACTSCHSSHDALGLGLLRRNPNRPPNVDDTSQNCFTCHDGSDNLSVPILNVLSDFSATGQVAHPFADSSNQHVVNEPIVLDRNRHATCADCHAAHAAQPTLAFPGTPDLRPSQIGVSGAQAGGTVVSVATYQYENCLRCHGTSDKKQSLAAYGYMPARALFAGDTLDVSLQFAHGALSSHPVMADAKNVGRPSVLRYMWDIDFKVQMRAMSSRILCTDCHNSDRNREFGGSGPNGPHGSRNDHILERQYIMSRVAPGAGPGTLITIGLNPTPILDAVVASPYALCAKCHDLNFINSGASWPEHTEHIQEGFSCSVCHSAHGVPVGTTGVSGGRALVSFDMNVVAQNSPTQPVTYNGGSSCTLTCHGRTH